MGVEKAVRTKQELSSQEISLATWTNVIKKKKKKSTSSVSTRKTEKSL